MGEIVGYLAIAVVLVGLAVLAGGVLPVLRRRRRLAAALSGVRAHRGQLAVLADRVDRLTADLAQLRVRALLVRRRMDGFRAGRAESRPVESTALGPRRG